MPTRRALLVPAVLVLALTVPAPPAQALPGCSGYFTFSATCQFSAPFASLVVVKATAAADRRSLFAQVAVGAYETAGTVVSCGSADLLATACTETGFVSTSTSFTCRVVGQYAGTYSCVAVPYLW